ncbi:MAG TPA: tetratricopeptide repeat protein [Usitatibacter sp.]|nr:tetratricopeptide repeat protein [Usitatibacter sp.]
MLHCNSVIGRLAAAIAVAWLAIAAGSAFAAPADDLKEAQKLYNEGKLQPALDKVDAFLKAEPKDPQGRFLKGLVLTEQKRTQEAIQVFTGLTEDYPELPEPYNNLAVLYASQGDYEKAKSALELAIHTHPTYATAHENLGDVYAELASRAYDRALQLDKNNASVKVKLAMVKDLFSAQKIALRAQTVNEQAPAAPSEAAKPAPAKPAAAKPQPAKTQSAQAEAAKVETTKPAEAHPAPPPKKEPEAASPSAAGDAKAQVEAAVQGWARAWSAKDVKGYLAYYASDFEVPGGQSREAWEKLRAERIEHPKSIEVEAKVLAVQVSGDQATVKIHQTYRSDALKSTNTKTLRLERSGDHWLIKQERLGG